MSPIEPDDEPEFTPEQLDALLQQAGEQARRKAFAAGRPVMILVGPARMPHVPGVRG